MKASRILFNSALANWPGSAAYTSHLSEEARVLYAQYIAERWEASRVKSVTVFTCASLAIPPHSAEVLRWCCTRPRGHEGPHAGTGYRGKLLVWYAPCAQIEEEG